MTVCLYKSFYFQTTEFNGLPGVFVITDKVTGQTVDIPQSFGCWEENFPAPPESFAQLLPGIASEFKFPLDGEQDGMGGELGALKAGRTYVVQIHEGMLNFSNWKYGYRKHHLSTLPQTDTNWMGWGVEGGTIKMVPPAKALEFTTED